MMPVNLERRPGEQVGKVAGPADRQGVNCRSLLSVTRNAPRSPGHQVLDKSRPAKALFDPLPA